MPDPTPVVNTNTPPSAAVASTPTQTPPAHVPAAGEGKTPTTVPYERFQEVNAKLREQTALMEDLEYKFNNLSAQVQNRPTSAPTIDKGSAEYNDDPLGYLRKQVDSMGQYIQSMARSQQVGEGEKLIAKIKTEYPVFAHTEWGETALEVLQSKMVAEKGLKSPSRIIREVAEKFSTLAAKASVAPAVNAAERAAATPGLPPGSSPAVGAVRTVPKFTSFDEAHKASRGAWDSIAAKIRGAAQI